MRIYTHLDADAQSRALQLLPDVSGRPAETVTTGVTKSASVPDKKK
jgi:hypothetical protein